MKPSEKVFSVLALIVFAFTFGAMFQHWLEGPGALRREAALPAKCIPGEQIVVTSSEPSQLFACEARWFRR